SAGPGWSAAVASTACPATVNTAGRDDSCISSSAAPPTTCRVTTNGDSPSKDSTFAAIATSARAATCAITSPPRGVPAAITTTDPDDDRTDRIPDAQDAPQNASNAAPVSACSRRTPYDASASTSGGEGGPTT